MLRFFILLSLSAFLSAPLADSQCPNATLPMSQFLFPDGILLKLKMELDLLSSSDEVQRVRLEAMSLRLAQQTQVLDKISSKLGIKSEYDWNVANNNCSSSPRYPSSCAEATAVKSQSGIYSIQLPSFSPKEFLVYCNAEEQAGGWTVIQRRVDDSIDFYRDWASYKIGFGNLVRNFFIGLDKLHALTYAAPQELLIILSDFENVTKYAKYEDFATGDELESYALNVLGKYSGDAGDSFTYHQGMKFSTKDKQNDEHAESCAEMFKGAWWYNSCHESNLNGVYLGGAYQRTARVHRNHKYTASILYILYTRVPLTPYEKFCGLAYTRRSFSASFMRS